MILMVSLTISINILFTDTIIQVKRSLSSAINILFTDTIIQVKRSVSSAAVI